MTGPNTTLVIAGVALQDMEVPEEISFGGEQARNKHLLPGGVRVIDAMGADDDDITWSGLILGPDASDRARLLDQYRKDGSPQSLTWWNLSFQVLIKRFKIKWQRYYQVAYEIVCEVIQDLSLPSEADTAPDADQLIDGDATSLYDGAESLGMDVPGFLPGPVASSVGISPGSIAITFTPGEFGIDLTDVAAGLTAIRSALSAA